MMMPDMDGLTTFEHLQADPTTRDIPVILFTAKGRVGERQPWEDHAIRGMIAKPYDPMTLGEQVSEILAVGRGPLERRQLDHHGQVTRAGAHIPPRLCAPTRVYPETSFIPHGLPYSVSRSRNGTASNASGPSTPAP